MIASWYWYRTVGPLFFVGQQESRQSVVHSTCPHSRICDSRVVRLTWQCRPGRTRPPFRPCRRCRSGATSAPGTPPPPPGPDPSRTTTNTDKREPVNNALNFSSHSHKSRNMPISRSSLLLLEISRVRDLLTAFWCDSELPGWLNTWRCRLCENMWMLAPPSEARRPSPCRLPANPADRHKIHSSNTQFTPPIHISTKHIHAAK